MRKKLFKEVNLKTIAICVFSFSISLLFQGCEQKQEDFGKTNLNDGDVLSIIGCKDNSGSLKSAVVDVPCATIQTYKNNYLAIEHVNAIFNCAFDSITIDFSVTGNVINIKENHVNPGMFCTCNYDIKYIIGPIEYGHYTIYIEDESQGNVISFEFDFSENTLLNYCNN